MAALADAIDDAGQVEELRRQLLTTQRQLAKAKAKRDELAAVTVESCAAAVLAHWKPAKITGPAPDRRKTAKPEVALWDTGDWQGSKVTPTYNSQVMRDRVMAFARKAARITEIQRADHPVRDAVLVFGGDMVEGLFNFPTQPFEIDATIFEQYVRVSSLLVDVTRAALATYERVTVVPEWGNHGRIGSKRDAVPRADNVDRMCFELARQLLAGEERLTWQDCPEDIQRVEVGNYRALVIHGDEIGRGGFASLNTILNWANRQRSGAYPWTFRDLYVHHYHTHYELALANGEGTMFGTGSTESDNRYANVMLAASAIPSQRLNFVDPVKGRVTAQYKILLDD